MIRHPGEARSGQGKLGPVFCLGWLILMGCPEPGTPVPPVPADLIEEGDLGEGSDGPGGNERDLRGKEVDMRADMAPPPEPAPALPICSVSKWCWENPLPQGNQLTGVWAFSASDVWACGGTGTVLHFDGRAWSGVPSGTEEGLTGLWGSAPNNLWAVGLGGTVLRWNGVVWSAVPSGVTENLLAVWGTGPSDIWAVGEKGRAIRWNGTMWQAVATGFGADLWGLWGSAPNDYWATLANTAGVPVVRWDGTKWSRITNWLSSSTYAKAVWGAGASDVWIFSEVPEKWDGSKISPRATLGGIPTYGAWGSRTDDVWAVGGQAVGRWNGTRWSTRPAPTLTDQYEEMRAVGGSGPSDVWAVSHRMHRWDGANWATTGSGGERPLLTRGWAAGPDDAWVVGTEPDGMGGDRGPILRRVGGKWVRAFTATNALGGIWGSGTKDIWAVGLGGLVVHWDGLTWKIVPSSTTSNLIGIFGFSDRDAIAVGANGTIVRWNGTMWSSTASGTTKFLSSVWGAAPNDVWAVGENGTILRWNGFNWNLVASGTTKGFFKAHGVRSNYVWAVGEDGTIMLWRGSKWDPIAGVINRNVAGIFADAVDSAWAVGGDAVAKWDGSKWSKQEAKYDLMVDVFGSKDGIWLSGHMGTIMRYTP